ncbi:FIG00469387: hypothetical protein [hydrothermal vent metagenome]|uniref:Uncharacterized protein n=1 Tax=hydrothermal vent metagenome TaxID=652676 RepID=A0A3B1E5U4_9ZZZZ
MISKKGFSYKFDETKCIDCQGNCCIGESGYVWVTKKEIYAISSFLDIKSDDFVSKYLRKISNRYSLKEILLSDDNYVCEFFDIINKQCSIYSVRPSQCVSFPFWDYFKNNTKEVKEECPAIFD